MKKLLLVLAAACGLAAVASAQCRDPWVSQAVNQVMARPAQGQGDGGECYIGNYGGGQWSSYQDLVNKVTARFMGVCRDPWVTSAVTQVLRHGPNGYGNSYDCYVGQYGGGQWSSYQDLVNKVQAHFYPAPVAAPTSGLRPPPAQLAPPGGFVGNNGSAIVAAGAGNFRPNGIVAAGAGNFQANGIVAAGAGNYYQRGTDDMKLAESGDPQAMYHVGQKFAADGKDQNLSEAYKWLSLAVENGVSDASDERKAVREKLTEDQVKQINAEVKDWKPTPVEAPKASAPPAESASSSAPADTAEKK